MICFRIHVGLPGGLPLYRSVALESSLCARIAQDFPGFTMYRALGYWKGQQEASRVFEVWAETGTTEDLEPLCRDLAALADQEEVGLAFVHGAWRCV